MAMVAFHCVASTCASAYCRQELHGFYLLRNSLPRGTVTAAAAAAAASAPFLCARPNLRKLLRVRARLDSDGVPADDTATRNSKIPFGYTRKDVLLIGLGLTAAGVVLKYGLELFGVDPLKAGNVVQLVMVLGLTIGWISTYIYRVSTKDMTYAKQLKDYEDKVMEKRVEEMQEAELELLLAEVEEEKQRIKAKTDLK